MSRRSRSISARACWPKVRRLLRSSSASRWYSGVDRHRRESRTPGEPGASQEGNARGAPREIFQRNLPSAYTAVSALIEPDNHRSQPAGVTGAVQPSFSTRARCASLPHARTLAGCRPLDQWDRSRASRGRIHRAILTGSPSRSSLPGRVGGSFRSPERRVVNRRLKNSPSDSNCGDPRYQPARTRVGIV